jgi:hypothetical protein
MPLPDVVSGLLLSGRSGVQIPFGAPQAMPKAFVFKGFRRFFIFTKKQQKRKNHKFSLANSPSANGI